MLEETGSAENLLGFSDRHLAAAGLGAEAIRRLRTPHAETLADWRAWLARPSRTLIAYGSRAYPPLLAAISDPPLALWADGRPELLAAPQIAIVGSRNATLSGRRTAEQLAGFLGTRGLAVTSGLAAGIDSAAHRGALSASGGTVAVLGCGIDVVFPRSNRQLAESIAAEGLVVSEYPPGVPPRAWQFPARNRIIAALALGTLVVEAGRRSGALITARLAAEYGREVFAVPGSIHNPLARGCHYLLKQGAKLVEDGGDVLVELAPLLELELAAAEPPPPGERTRNGPEDGVSGADPAYASLLEKLGHDPTSIAELAAESALTAAELSSMLLVLELEGFVEALPGGRYCRLPARSR
ncbi:MAG TPA: DNA-processing protein DprA [Gammaproteobacteria bacterium]|nr:DNA-processing protein DprA [Gammaproteobacteria bacterium]